MSDKHERNDEGYSQTACSHVNMRGVMCVPTDTEKPKGFEVSIDLRRDPAQPGGALRSRWTPKSTTLFEVSVHAYYALAYFTIEEVEQ